MEHKLKRSLTFPLLTLYGLGTIVGAGIYVLVGKVAGVAGMYAPIAFLVSAVLVGFTAYSYAKLSARYPLSAGEALYVNKAFSLPALSAIVGWLVIATGVVSSATITRGFVGYFAVFIDMPSLLAMTLLLVAIALVACWGIAESVTIAAIITAIEITGLLVIVWVLRNDLGTMPQHMAVLTPPLESAAWLAIFAGAFLAFYASIGFEDMVNVAEEVVKPEVTMPWAILAALLVSATLYVLVSLSAILAMPLDELVASNAPMVDLLQSRSESLAASMGIISLVAVINGALIQVIMGARILYGMGCQKLAWNWFTKVNPHTRTPVRATVVVALIVWILAVAFPLVTLAKLTSFIVLVVFTMVNLSLLAIHFRDEHILDNVVEIIIPVLGALSCISMLLLQLYFLATGASINLLH